MDNIQKQLIAKLGEEFSNIFPLQYVSNILDKATGKIKDIQVRGTGGVVESLLLTPPTES